MKDFADTSIRAYEECTKNVNLKLKKYVEEKIFPVYNKNEKAHDINHINYVIRRSFELIKQNNLNVNTDIVFAIAAYHDIGHYIDSKKHELVSADMMYKDENLKKYFSNEERIIIKEAIEDHRASSDHEPRSIYGKLVSSADRNNTVEQCLERSYYYGKKLDPSATELELHKRAFKHLNLKFGQNGYAKFFLNDSEYESFLTNIRKILKDEKEFCKIQANYIKKIENKEN